MTLIEQKGEHSMVFSKHIEPIATVKPGDVFSVHTQDAFKNLIQTKNDLPEKTLAGAGYLNPQTGPIYVEGAEPGDTLKIKIHEIEPTRDWAVSCIDKKLGALAPTAQTRMISEPLEEQVWIYRQDENGDYVEEDNKNLRFPYEPFIGTIATADDLESISALTPYGNGGNMDSEDVSPGNIVHLPVDVEGAYFFVGDVHANQGQGELGGVALEIAAKVTLEFELIKNKAITWPRIESETELMTVGSARPMEDASRIAYAELLEWMVELGWEKMEAYQALTQGGKLYCANMVDPNYSMVAKIDKKMAYAYQ